MIQDEERRRDDGQLQSRTLRHRHYPDQCVVVYYVPGTSKEFPNYPSDLRNRHSSLARQRQMSYIRAVSRHAESYDWVASTMDGVPRCPGAKAINQTVSLRPRA